MEELWGEAGNHTHTATASACSLLMKEPPHFLDSAITGYKLTVTHGPPQSSFSLEHQVTSPPPPAAVVEDLAGAPLHCCYWGHSLCRDCHRRRLAGGHRGQRPLPSSQLRGDWAADAAPGYRRIYSHVQSFGNSFYAYLQTVIGIQLQQGSSPARQNQGNRRTPNPDSPDVYESKLSKARWAARSVGSFYNLSTFLALCSLTWATVVLLGASVDDLSFADYVMVTALLLLEAVRLASASFFTILLTHGLARRSQDPLNIIHGVDDQYRRAFAARILSSLLQTVLISPSFVCPFIRFGNINYHDIRHLHNSLLIFYLLIMCNAIVSSVTLFFSSASFIYLRDRHDQSILRFYDELVQRAISFGVIQADDFEFFQFAYRMLGSEFARIVQPEAVVKNHRKLIEYLYRHRLGQDFLLMFLKDGDAFVQQAAVNMVGFWADPSKVGLKEVKLAKKVLTEMADKVGSGQLGWAAVNSFGAVARRDPSILAKTRMSSGMPLLDWLAELVDGKSSSSLTYVRTLALFYHYSHQKEQDVPLLEKKRRLVGKLKQLLAEARVQRPRLFAAYLLHLMGNLDESCYDHVAAIRPSRDAYWFEVELDLFFFMRRQCRIHEPPPDLGDLPRDFVRREDNICRDGKRFL